MIQSGTGCKEIQIKSKTGWCRWSRIRPWWV